MESDMKYPLSINQALRTSPLWILIFLLCLCSCNKNDSKQENLTRIQKGITTESEIIQLFGEPDSIVNGARTDVLNYNKVTKDQPYMSHLSIVVNVETKRVINYRYFITKAHHS